MIRVIVCVLVLCGIQAWSVPGNATEPDAGLGEIHFANSGAASAQAAFTRGLLLLHSFEYDSARTAFQEAERADRGFALAYWGEALTYNHTLWGEQDLSAARAALAKLAATAGERQRLAATPRERDYLATVEALYGSGGKEERDRAYCDALEALVLKYPDDLEARAFYSLALLGTTGGKRDFAVYMRAAAQAEAVLQVAPRHPGALHYLIHAYDDPIHAPLGLRAARLYGQVAPHAEHALHMPSHIYFAMGLWQDAIEANAGSLHESHAAGESGYHALLWLQYAYLQTGQYDKAAALVHSLEIDASAPAAEEARVRLAFARAVWLNDAPDNAAVSADVADDSRGIAAIAQFAVHDFARGLHAAAHGRLDASQAALDTLQTRIEAARSANHAITTAWFQRSADDDRIQAESLALALQGVVTFKRGDHPTGIARVKSALAHAAPLEFEYGPPWSAKPLEEVLGELLLEDGQGSQAIEVFRNELKTYPNRMQALSNLRQAISLAAATATRAPPGAEAHAITRSDLVGVWRLSDIVTTDARGSAPDPFYGPHPTGLLIYDANGYFSVQIVSMPRPNAKAPLERLGEHATQAQRAANSRILDGYYAYYGQWEYDPDTSAVTHHVEHALFPTEDSEAYVQRAEVHGNQLVFTRTAHISGAIQTQRKVWERVP